MPELDDAPALLFFAFRALTAEPDRILAERGLGRVHHRILYFVARRPGLRIGALLALLGVSKQALHGPLNALVRRGLVAATVPAENRRAKELRLTPAGARLERRLTDSQRRRFRRAFSAEGFAAEAAWRNVMRRLALEGRGPPPGSRRPRDRRARGPGARGERGGRAAAHAAGGRASPPGSAAPAPALHGEGDRPPRRASRGRRRFR